MMAQPMLLLAVHDSTIANAHPKPIPALAAVSLCRFSTTIVRFSIGSVIVSLRFQLSEIGEFLKRMFSHSEDAFKNCLTAFSSPRDNP